MNRPSPTPSCKRARRGERGFTLAALIVILTVIGIFIAFTVPQMWSDVMKRERDLQTQWVMKQYARAIQDYVDQRKVFPTKLEELKEQQKPRVLRQLYVNPLSGKLDWVLVPFGTPTDTTGGGPAPVGGSLPNGATGPTSATGNTLPVTGAQSGPFIGVKPPQTGKCIIAFRGADTYDKWVYTTNELTQERAQLLGGSAGGPGGPAGPSGPRQ